MPFTGLRYRLKRWALKRRGWRGVAHYIESGDGTIDFKVVVPVVRELGGCPDAGVVEALERAGLYEEIVLLALRGCSVDPSVLARARGFFLAAGLPKWERAASTLLGVESFYDAAAGGPAFAVCTGGRVYLRAGGASVSVDPSSSPRLAGDAREALAVFLSRGRPSVYVYWGDCPRPEGVPSVDARLLLLVAYPDVPQTLAGVAYHFHSPPGDPALAVERAVAAAVWVLEEVGVDWRRLPGEVAAGRLLEPSRPQAPGGGGLLVTDRPRLAWGVYKPYELRGGGGEARTSGWEYAAWAALRSLALRSGDPARAYWNSSGTPLERLLPGMIAGGVRWSGAPAREGQVEPWHLGLAEPGGVVYDCTVPPGLCASKPMPPWEAALYRAAGLPEPPEPRLLPGESRAPVTPADRAAGVSGPEAAGVVVHSGSHQLWRPCDAAAAALGLAGGRRGRVLLVAPGRALARALARCVDGAFLDEGGVDEWLAGGGVAAASWRHVSLNPEVLAAADTVVAVYPERMARSGVEEALALAASLGGRAVSRALARARTSGGLEGRVVLSDAREEVDGDVGLEVEDLMRESEEVFAEHWGRVIPGARLRPYQAEALRVLYTIASRLEAGLELVILPTGAGKSAIFQVAARVLADNGAGYGGLVVSPLRALMHDQVEGARRRGFRAEYIDSSVPRGEKAARVEAALSGLLDLLYITPERFADPAFDEAFTGAPPALVVLDEAHTLSRWGMSFRPGYLHMARRLAAARGERGWPPVLALTATAPPDVAEDILSAVGADPSQAVEARVELDSAARLPPPQPGRPYIIRAPPVRRELVFDVQASPHGPERVGDVARLVGELAEWAESQGGPWVGVVFTGYVRSTRMPWANAESLAAELSRRLGVEVAVYHGRLGERERRRVEEAVARASRGGPGPRVVVATKAFGMGVDIPNIRFVVHASPSDSIEDYYQEVGRAGRDGRTALAVALYDPRDFKAKAAMKLREAVRPSRALVVYNAIVSVASASSDGRSAAVPLQLLSDLAGGEAQAYRSLEALRQAGLLEYTVVRGPLAIQRGRGCLVDLKGGRCLDPDPSGEPAEARLCGGDEVAPRVSIGGCPTGRGYRLEGRVVVAWLDPERRHSQVEVLPPDAFHAIVAMRAGEALRVEQLRELLEAALKARLRGGRPAADRVVREGIARYLSSPRRRPEPPGGLQGKRVECQSLDECLRELAGDAARLAEALGHHSFTAAAPDSGHAARLKAALEAALARPVEDPRRAYRRVRAVLRSKPRSYLMDYGYLLLLVRAGSRQAEALEKALAGYPYHALYLSP